MNDQEKLSMPQIVGEYSATLRVSRIQLEVFLKFNEDAPESLKELLTYLKTREEYLDKAWDNRL